MRNVLAPVIGVRRGKRKKIRGYHRRWVYMRHLGLCFICGEFVPWEEATVDHWVPIAHGGKHSRYNFVLSCLDCNQKKGNLIPADEEKQTVDTELQEIRDRFQRV